jgi:hypothetical protein
MAGNPGPNSEAAKLAKRIAEAEDRDNFASLIASDERRVAEAERALGKYREERCRELLEEMLPDGEAAIAEWRDWVAEGREKLRALIEIAGRATNISAQARTFDTRSIPGYNHHQQALRALERNHRCLSRPAFFWSSRRRATMSDFAREFAAMVNGEPKDQNDVTPGDEGAEQRGDAQFLADLFSPKKGDEEFIRSMHGDGTE